MSESSPEPTPDNSADVDLELNVGTDEASDEPGQDAATSGDQDGADAE